MVPAGILGSAMYPRLARASADTATLREEVRSALRPLLWFGGLAAAGTVLAIVMANTRSTGTRMEIDAAPPSSVPAIVAATTTAMRVSTWMLCGVRTTVTSGDAVANRRPSSSIAARVLAAS